MTTPDEEITGYGGQPRTGSTSPGAGSSGGASSAGANVAEDAKAKARHAAEQVKNQGKGQLDGYRETAAAGIEKVAQSAKAAAAELDTQNQEGLSHYVSDMAQSMVEFADNLRGKSVDQLLGDVNRLARNNPALFITGSIAVGFGLTRFARASSQRSESDYRHHHDSHTGSPGHRTGGAYGDADGLPSQHEINEHIASGEPRGTIGSVSNAGVSSATSTSRPTAPGSTGAGSSVGTRPAEMGAGLGTHSSGSLGTNNNRDGKGTDGGFLP